MWIYSLTIYLLTGLGANLGYHRLLAHRALRVPRWLERALVIIGLPAGTPVQWTGNHRAHHAHADRAGDPHSPVERGFWYAHTGWYFESHSVGLAAAYAALGPLRMLADAWMRPRANPRHNGLARDLAADPWYRSLSRPAPYAAAMLVHFVLGVGIPVSVWGWRGALLAWATYAAVYNLGDAVNSMLHASGGVRNHPVLGVVQLGEGWHANHHLDPGCARHGRGTRQFDWTWQVIRALRACGLATEVNARQ